MINKLLEPLELDNTTSLERITGNWGDIKWLFNIYRNKDFKKGNNLISVSYFLKDNVDLVYSYQKGKKLNEFQKNHIEKMKRYNEGLNIIIKKNKRTPFNSTVRIYCDITTINIVKKYLNLRYVELYYYYFPNFFDSKSLTHIGFFGTIIRYIPLFNAPKHNDGDWFTTAVIDIDTSYWHEYKLMKYYIDNKRRNANFPNVFYKNRGCYYMESRLMYYDLETPYFSIIGSFVMQHKPQDFKYFIEFIDNSLTKKCERFECAIEKYLKDLAINRPFGGKLEYGVDEFFLNVNFVVSCYIDNNKDLLEVFIRDKTFGINEWLYYLVKEENLKLKNPKIVEQFLLMVVDLFLDENYKLPRYKDVYELIHIIEREFFTKRIFLKIFPKEKYKKVFEFVEKIGPEELNMPPKMLQCIKRPIETNQNALVVKIVKPNPKYPEFTEKTLIELN